MNGTKNHGRILYIAVHNFELIGYIYCDWRENIGDGKSIFIVFQIWVRKHLTGFKETSHCVIFHKRSGACGSKHNSLSSYIIKKDNIRFHEQQKGRIIFCNNQVFHRCSKHSHQIPFHKRIHWKRRNRFGILQVRGASCKEVHKSKFEGEFWTAKKWSETDRFQQTLEWQHKYHFSLAILELLHNRISEDYYYKWLVHAYTTTGLQLLLPFTHLPWICYFDI